jgi:DNA-binding transcriptional LysR family regulator
MDLRSLRAFAEVADLGSFSRAASTLGIAQSALSRQVSALEREVGARLFHRTGRGVAVTEIGGRLVPRAKAVLSEAGEFMIAAQDARAGPAGEVEFGVVPGFARPLLGVLCQRLRREFPRVRLRAREGYSGQVEEWLATGRVEVALFNRYRRGGARNAEPLLRSDILLVGPPGHPALQTPEVPLRALAGVALAMPVRPNGLATLLFALAASRGIVLDVAIEGSTATILVDALIHAGLCSPMPRHAVARELDAGILRAARIVSPVIKQTTWLAVGSQRPATAAARVVARTIRELAAEFLQRGTWVGSTPASGAGKR